MRERDLRRQALESGKTVSKKAKAKALSSRSSQAGSTTNSPATTPAHSPDHSPGTSCNGSRTVSRQGSEEDDESDDELKSSVAGLDMSSFSNFEKAPYEVWQSELREVVDQIIERSRNKRNTAEAREEMLAVYTNILRAQYAAAEVESQMDDLVPALIKSFKSGSSDRESVFGLQALAVTILSIGEQLFEEVHQPLRSRIQDPSSPAAQEVAMHALGIAAFFGGADSQDAEDVMSFLLDIADSDGESVEALDNGSIVSAALQAWGLLATMFPDLKGRTEDPMKCFENQLESTNFDVQCAAMENIALLYEQSFTLLPEGASSGSEATEHDDHETGIFRRKRWTRSYVLFTSSSDEYPLKSTLAELSRSSARYMAKDKRKDLHAVAKDVLHTIEHPYRGPRYSTALDENMMYYMGHRYVVKFSGKERSGLTIDRWWKLHRYEAIKRVLAGGFQEHFQRNDIVKDCLPAGSLVAPTEF